eukprot:1155292-Pelagomonas_calceolata.AAC.2
MTALWLYSISGDPYCLITQKGMANWFVIFVNGKKKRRGKLRWQRDADDRATLADIELLLFRSCVLEDGGLELSLMICFLSVWMQGTIILHGKDSSKEDAGHN